MVLTHEEQRTTSLCPREKTQRKGRREILSSKLSHGNNKTGNRKNTVWVISVASLTPADFAPIIIQFILCQSLQSRWRNKRQMYNESNHILIRWKIHTHTQLKRLLIHNQEIKWPMRDFSMHKCIMNRDHTAICTFTSEIAEDILGTPTSSSSQMQMQGIYLYCRGTVMSAICFHQGMVHCGGGCTLCRGSY